jgi:hypothetical protein
MKIFKNNIFTNPVGWAEAAVGTMLRYRAMQVLTILMGLAAFLLLRLLVPEGLPLIKKIGIGMIILPPIVILPLCYLRSMRHLLLKLQTNQKPKNE